FPAALPTSLSYLLLHTYKPSQSQKSCTTKGGLFAMRHIKTTLRLNATATGYMTPLTKIRSKLPSRVLCCQSTSAALKPCKKASCSPLATCTSMLSFFSPFWHLQGQ
ncbi:hypothetical protein BD309DRAFT_455122, partial [Dichomitus squalens]